MNAPATFTQLPLDGLAYAPQMSAGAIEGETPPAFTPCPQYRRLFGLTRPDQVIVSVAPAILSADDGTCGSPAALCDPTQPESHPLFDYLTEAGHPSAAALASVAALRERHLAKGRTPATDAEKGSAHFWRCADQAWHDAIRKRSRAERRSLLIVAAAILIAQIDAEDFTASQQEATRHE